MHFTVQTLLLVVVVGGVAGWLADRSQYGHGFGLIGDGIIGAVGAFVGLWAFPRLGIHIDGTIGAVIAAVVGAAVFVFFGRLAGDTWGPGRQTASSTADAVATPVGKAAAGVADAVPSRPSPRTAESRDESRRELSGREFSGRGEPRRTDMNDKSTNGSGRTPWYMVKKPVETEADATNEPDTGGRGKTAVAGEGVGTAREVTKQQVKEFRNAQRGELHQGPERGTATRSAPMTERETPERETPRPWFRSS